MSITTKHTTSGELDNRKVLEEALWRHFMIDDGYLNPPLAERLWFTLLFPHRDTLSHTPFNLTWGTREILAAIADLEARLAVVRGQAEFYASRS